MPGVKITDTTLRDAHQSLWATRMRTSDMLPILDKLDAVGYHSLEVWGGATFDVCLRYLNEDPWERLKVIKRIAKRTPLQMLLRGQSVVGYQHYPDDVVTAFVHKMVENGIDIIRVFDALNDIRNLETAVRAGREAGAHVQAAVVYTISPVHTTEHYIETAQSLAAMGAHSICIKDMAGLLDPYNAYELVKLFKERVGLPVQLHSHYIGGLALTTYLKAAEAGVDVIDTASVPLAFGSSQPPVETVVRMLQGSPYESGLDLHLLFDLAEYFEEVRKENSQDRGVTRINDMRVFDHQVPGGMISNLVTQLKEQKALSKLPEVLQEIPRVRAELGYPPLVTPTSQIVGTQAVLNVLTGERYKLVPGEVRAYLQGLYGRPPAPLTLDEAVLKKALGDKERVTCRPADLLEPKMDKIRAEVKDLARSEEDVLSYAMFPQVAKRFLEARNKPDSRATHPLTDLKRPMAKLAASNNKPPAPEEEEDMNLQDVKELIKLIDKSDVSEVILENDGVKIAIKKGGARPGSTGGAVEDTDSTPAPAKEPAPCKAPVEREGLITVPSPMVGTFYRAPAPDEPSYVEAGHWVEKGQTLCIIEAMKLMNEIEAEVSGEVVEILVENAAPVEYGQPLMLIKTD